MIRNVLLLDLMDTLITDPYADALRAGTGLGREDIRRLRDPDAWPAFEVGTLDEEGFFKRFWAEGVDRPFDAAAFHRARRAGYRWIPGMRELLDDLAGVAELHAASNYPVWVEELRSRFALGRWFTGVWASHHVGVRKPDPAFFTRVLSGVGAAPEQALLVDDRESNCAAARELGLAAHRFTDVDGLRARLQVEELL